MIKMKKLVLPQNQGRYTPQGIYAFSKDQRRSAFEKLMNNNSEERMMEYRINARKKMRCEL